jgi:adenosine deaminase
LIARRIPLDISVTSNLKTGVVPSLYEHPVRKLFDAGVLITINSDDPAMFYTTLNQEYLLLVERFGFTISEIGRLLVNAIEASFLTEERKQSFKQDFLNYRNQELEA